MSLTEFLLARITEDEEAAREPQWLALEYGLDSYGRQAFSTRVLAECESKRWIVTDLELSIPECGDNQPDGKQALELVLKSMAMVYAGHADYRDEWRP